jgi:transposase
VIRFEVPEQSLPEDHPARLLWRIVETLEISAFLAKAKAVEGRQGRDQTSVRMLLTLWLYAITEGIHGGREIERRTREDPAFRWIVGDQRVGRTTLNEFRVAHRGPLEGLFTDVLGVLLDRGLVTLDLVGQDGTRVRASASAPSFRRERSLEACREQAALHVKAVLAAADDPEAEKRQQRANEAKAKAAQQRVEDAIATLRELRARGVGGDKPRASTTDADARVMKMPDGGFRPAYNVQFSTAGDPMGGPRTIVGVRVTNEGTDAQSVAPMLDQIEERTGQLPGAVTADAQHATIDDIKGADARGVETYIAVPDRMQNAGPKGNCDPAVVAWKERMESSEGKEVMRSRSSLCELSNAHAKTRFGLDGMPVRGLNKVTCVVLMVALTANLLAHAQRLLA